MASSGASTRFPHSELGPWRLVWGGANALSHAEIGLPAGSRDGAHLVDSQPTVFIVDDDVDYLPTVANMVASMGFVPEPYRSVDDFLAAFDLKRPGCLVLEIQFADRDGMGLLKHLAAQPIAPPAIILTSSTAIPPIVQSSRLGVEAYLQKHCFAQTTLWESIQSALARDAIQRAAYIRRCELLNRMATLNPRERVVLDLLVQGLDHKRIANDLGVSRRTVENRRSRIMEKLGADTFPKLIAMAIEAAKKP